MTSTRRHSFFIRLGLTSLALVATLAAEEPIPTATVKAVDAACANTGEIAPVAVSRDIPAAAADGEIAPIAKECVGAGCDHRPAGGPGQSSGVITPVYAPANQIQLVLDFNASRDQVILSFYSTVPHSAGAAIYRIEGTSDLATGSWSSVWEGSAADVDADGGVSMPLSLEGGDRFFRVLVLATE